MGTMAWTIHEIVALAQGGDVLQHLSSGHTINYHCLGDSKLQGKKKSHLIQKELKSSVA